MEKVVGTEQLADRFGIEIISLRISGGGHMLDLRYRVLDTEKAHQVLRVASRVDVMIIHRPSNVVGHVPDTMLGKMRGKAALARTDVIYYIIFKNPDQTIQSGTPVDIQFGDLTVKNWRVQ